MSALRSLVVELREMVEPLLEAKLKLINKAGATAEQLAQAEEGLEFWTNSTDQLAAFDKGTTAKLLAVRYRFELEEVIPAKYTAQTTFSFRVIPVGGTPKKNEWGKETQLYGTPKEALAEIPTNGAWAYRGMSWEEWKQIRKRGFVQSRGGYNIGQEGLTFFGPRPSMGQSYASGFAPLQHMASKRRPGVVIAIERKLTLTPKDRDDIPDGELAVLGRVPLSEVKGVWLLVPTEARSGSMDLIRGEKADGSGLWREGSRSSPSIYTALVTLRSW